MSDYKLPGYTEIEIKNTGIWITDSGCGCCSGVEKITSLNIDVYIEEYEDALRLLKRIKAGESDD